LLGALAALDAASAFSDVCEMGANSSRKKFPDYTRGWPYDLSIVGPERLSYMLNLSNATSENMKRKSNEGRNRGEGGGKAEAPLQTGQLKYLSDTFAKAR
jgi:hypothetical protein